MSDLDKRWLLVSSLMFLVVVPLFESLMVRPGERVTIYAVIAAITVLQALHSSRTRRIWAVLATLLILGRLVWDNEDGKTFRETLTRSQSASGNRK
jgi:hypothetical protein